MKEEALLTWEKDPASGGDQTPSLWQGMVHRRWQMWISLSLWREELTQPLAGELSTAPM